MDVSTGSTSNHLAPTCASPCDIFGPPFFEYMQSSAEESWEEAGESSGTESELASVTQGGDENEDEGNLECTPPMTVGGKWYGRRMIVSVQYTVRKNSPVPLTLPETQIHPYAMGDALLCTCLVCLYGGMSLASDEENFEDGYDGDIDTDEEPDAYNDPESESDSDALQSEFD